ncbi:hypothetical protein [Flavobacterium aestivum]|uniref:hypothetical protein n=1 Tax=Flavobacterium aestivum TaxID=3003257 RepID=UPI002285C8AF|nr:hypothetical protein [Flavobacterium aestivum]
MENQIKEKINAREITPSKASWDRLDAMLTVAEKPKLDFRWMYVAASLLGFLLLGTLYFNQNNKETIVAKDAVVVSEANVVPEIKATSTKTNLIKTVEETKSIKEKLVSTEIRFEEDSNNILLKKEIQVVEKTVTQEEQIPIITRGFADCLERSGKNQKTEQPNVLQKSKYVNVDELLASVDNPSQKKNPIQVKSNVKVNSNELLTQVDGELDLSFREKAIKTVNQKFKAAKLALSSRNSE